MADDFFARTEALMESVGDGLLVGRTEVNQPYAWNQHEGRFVDLAGRYGPHAIRRHPMGGGPPPSRFLGNAVEERREEFVRRLADSVLDGGLIPEMVSIQEDLCLQVHDRAPEFSGRLKDSGAPSVHDAGAPVYARPPKEERKEGGEPLEGVPKGYYDG